MRRCIECSCRKPLTDFYLGGYNGTSPNRRCKECFNRLKKAKRAAALTEESAMVGDSDLANRFLRIPRPPVLVGDA